MTIKNIDDVLNFAIQREQEAHDFYIDLSTKVERNEIKQIFKNFASEELGHKKKLENVKAGKKLQNENIKVQDLKIAEQVEDVTAESEMGYQQALIFAMKREKAAYKLYNSLADYVDNQGVKQLFQELAQEEAKHKLRFEIEYDDNILLEN